MEDKIKQLYEAISSSSDFTGIFTTPEEMVSTYDKDPNGFFDAINSSADFSGIFKDADDFAISVGLKKKDEPTASPTIQEDIYGVSRMPADYLQQPSEEKPEQKQADIADYILTPENIKKDIRESGTSFRPINYSETLAESPTLTSATRAATRRAEYNQQQAELAQSDITRELEDFISKTDEEYTSKAQKEGANPKALEEERMWKIRQFLAAKEKDLGKRIEDIYNPDKYELLGEGDVKALKEQVAYVTSQPMTFEQRDKAYGMLKDRFMSKLAGMPEEYKDLVRGEVEDVINRHSIVNDKGDLSMYAWKKEASQKISQIDANISKLDRDFKNKYPNFNPNLPTGAQSFALKGGGDLPTYKEYNSYLSDRRLLSTSKEKLGRVMNMPEVGNFATEFRNQGIDFAATLASLGLSDIATAASQKETAQRYAKGKQLTAGERAAFDTIAIFNNAASAIEETAGMKLGRAVAQGLPFIEQMAVMGFFGLGGNIGLETVTGALKKAGVDALTRKGLGIIGKEAAKAIGTYAAASPLMPISWVRQQEGLTGQQKLNKEGVWEVDKKTVEGWLEATYKGLATGATEMISEAVGEFLPFGRVFSVIEKVTGVKFNPAQIPGLAGILKTAKLNSIPAEVIEELINIPLQGLLIGDEPLSEVTLRDVWDTIWTTAGFTAILGGAAIPGGTINGIRRARNYDVIKMFGKDNVSAVRDAIIAGDRSQWTVAMVNALKGKTAEDLGMSPAKAAQRLARYAKGVAAETVAITQRIDKMPEGGIAAEPLTVPAGEQKTTETGGIKDAEAVAVMNEYLRSWGNDVLNNSSKLAGEMDSDYDMVLTKLKNMGLITTDCV